MTVGVATWAKLVQPVPEQRSTLYSATPTLSVEAVQLRLIDADSVAVAVKFVGAVGGVVSCIGGGALELLHPTIRSVPNTAHRVT